jgi:hypothetical protein
MRHRNFWVLIGVPLALIVVGAGAALSLLTVRHIVSALWTLPERISRTDVRALGRALRAIGMLLLSMLLLSTAIASADPRHSSPPLREPCTLAGHALVTMWLEADQPDAAIHVYLQGVEEDGRSRYVTEGMLRALHRKTAPCPAHHKTSWPWRTFARSDAAILPRGAPMEITLALLPVGWEFKVGSRVRLAVSGGDRDHFVQVPHGRPPRLRIHHGIAPPSRLVLPVRSGA